MASSTSNLAYTNATVAEFRTWGKALSDALAAGGMTKTADVGQIDWLTVAVPAANTDAGYEIWKSNDGLTDWFFKIIYGTGSGTRPRLKIQVGWGTDLAGNLTGNVSDVGQLENGNGAFSTLHAWNFCVDDDGISINISDSFNAGASQSNTFIVERVRTKQGVKTDELFIWAKNYAVQILNQVVPLAGLVGVNTTTSYNGWRSSRVAASYVYAGNNGVAWLAPQKGGYLMEAMGICAGVSTYFASPQQIYTMNVYGQVHKYILNRVGASITLSGLGHYILTRYDD